MSKLPISVGGGGGVLGGDVVDDGEEGREGERVGGEQGVGGEGALGEELGEVLEEVGAGERAVVVEEELGGEAGHAQQLQHVVQARLLCQSY